MSNRNQAPYRPYSQGPEGQVHTRNVSQIGVQDIEQEPFKYVALALVHLKGKLEKIATIVEDRSRPLDVYQPQTIAPESTPVITLQPAWEVPEKITSVIITGPATTALAVPASGGVSGNITSPGAGATIVNSAPLTGLYNITVTVWVSGTVGTADNDNIQLVFGATVINLSDVGTSVTPIQYPFQLNPNGNGLTVRTINAGTVGSIYHAAITFTPVNPSPTSPNTMVLQLGDRVWNLTMPASGILTISPIAVMLNRSDLRQLTVTSPGEYTLELMGYADTRGNLT